MTLRRLVDDGRAWWSVKAVAERRLFVGLATVFILTAWWSLIWSPVQDVRRAAIQSLEQITTAEMTLAGIPAGPSGRRLGPVDPETARAMITSSAAAAGITIRQIEADGNAVRVAVEPLAFDALMIWLEGLSVTEGIGVSNARIERQPEPGFVSAELVLAAK